MEDRPSIFSRRIGFFLLSPSLVFVAIFLIFPFIWVIFLSFTNRTLTGATAANPAFVGLDNYARLLDPDRWMRAGEFGSSLLITVQFVFGSALIGQAGLGLLIAWMFFRRRGWLRSTVTTLAVLAWIIPEVVVAFAWFAFLDWRGGTLNTILQTLGLGRPDWLFDHALLSIIIFNTWRGTAFSMLLFQSALETIPPSYIETADVAGASGWQKFRDILLPLLKGHIITDLILITLWTFNTFTPFLLTGGGPVGRTQLVSIYTYNTAFRFFEFGRGSSIAVVMMFINLALALIYLSILRQRKAAA